MFWHSWHGVFSACRKSSVLPRWECWAFRLSPSLLLCLLGLCRSKGKCQEHHWVARVTKKLKYHYFHQNHLTINIFSDLAWNSLSKMSSIDKSISHEGLKEHVSVYRLLRLFSFSQHCKITSGFLTVHWAVQLLREFETQQDQNPVLS